MLMREAGRITGNALKAAGRAIEPGMSTKELDLVVRRSIEGEGAKPSFLGLYGFKGSACISINNQVIHGIPSKDVIMRSGDIVSVDVGAYIHGYHGDSAYTFACGDISPEAQRLLDTTRESLYMGIKQAVKGKPRSRRKCSRRSRRTELRNSSQGHPPRRGHGHRHRADDQRG